jgi:hypothetical protein
MTGPAYTFKSDTGSTGEETEMNRTRDNAHRRIRGALGAACIAGGTLLASHALAEQVSIQFSQSYPGGGTVTGLLVGEDLDGDGRLYSVAPGLADEVGVTPGGDEVTYASVTIRGVLGEPVTNVFDASVADINDSSNFFWGFAYNLDGGPLGDDLNEGVSFAPLAPSTSYVAGALFASAFTPVVIPDPIGACGNEAEIACSALITLDPVDPFPNFELLFADTSLEPIVTHELLRYTFEQDGFDGGASITGTISGRDLDGDGRIYSASPFVAGELGLPAGDEVVFAQVEIIGVEPEAIRNVQDLIADPIDSLPAFFFFASVNVAGGELGDEPGEGISIAPFSPSTSYIAGEAASPIFSPSIIEPGLSDCGNDAGDPCGALVSLTPNPDVPTGVDLQAVQYSAEPIAQNAAPLVVDGAFSGHWFNQVPSGEGVIVQIATSGQALVYWLTYDEMGDQRWLFSIARREGLRIVGDDVFATEGGMPGATAPVIVGLEPVGSLEIEFSGCNRGTMRAMVDGVPRTMDIGRLTGLNGLECVR